MTMREEFDAWMNLPVAADSDPAPWTNWQAIDVAWEAWQAAYRAGQEEMRERAAKVCDEGLVAALADRIRALPVDA